MSRTEIKDSPIHQTGVFPRPSLDQLLGDRLIAAGLALALSPSSGVALSVGALFLLEAVARTVVGGGASSSLSITAMRRQRP